MALQIHDRRERALVTAGDAVLTTLATAARPFRRRRRPAAPARILLLRLERIGDLLMALPAITDVRDAAPGARIDLVVGSWNGDLARAIVGVDRVEMLDAPWLARGTAGAASSRLLRTAASWRRERYDLAINFEPDVRTNLLLALSGARWRAGYRSGGGGAVLDQALEYLPAEHTTDNARRLVAQVFAREAPASLPARTLVAPEATRVVGRVLGRQVLERLVEDCPATAAAVARSPARPRQREQQVGPHVRFEVDRQVVPLASPHGRGAEQVG
jgi:hypothetical protein